MLKIYFLILVLFICSINLKAYEHKNATLVYLKAGASSIPSVSSHLLPTVGLGGRFQRDHYGCDLSANLTSEIFTNYLFLRGLFLYYPQLQKKHPFYVGVGPGLGYYGEWYATHKMLTVDAVLGYEFRHAPHFKTFIQLELSQPAFVWDAQSSHRHYGYHPGWGLHAGIGF